MERVGYSSNQSSYEGLFLKGRREPDAFVVIYHEYLGLEAHIIDKAKDLNRKGFSVFVADLYGRTVRPENHNQTYPHYRLLRDNPQKMKARSLLGLEQGKRCLEDPTNSSVAVLGFSMGGWAALEAAKGSSDIDLAVSVYGYLDGPARQGLAGADCNLLIFHGLKDKIVPLTDLNLFLSEAEALESKVESVIYSSVGHGFCNPSLKADHTLGSFYDAVFHKRAWQRILNFLDVYL